MKNSRYYHVFNHTIVAAVAVVLFGAIGTYFHHTSSAASASYSHNPIGYADSCSLSGTTTYIHGWAHDPDAPAGNAPSVTVSVTSEPAVTVTSNIANYRDAEINSFIQSSYPGMPTSSVYGWQLSFSNLYKGSSYGISGTVINYGSGANAALTINTNHSVDGTVYFSGGQLPDSCLSPKPTPPSPVPTPAPTPKPVKTAPKSSPAAPSAPTISSSADAAVTAGTTAADLVIPTGNASNVTLHYGTDPAQLSQTADATVSDDSATVALTSLLPKTTYTYQISRLLAGQGTISPAATFTTKGYAISLTFTDKNGKPVSGVQAQLSNGASLVSSKDGTITFADLAAGSYSPIFTYNGSSYSEDFSTSSAALETGTNGIVLEKTIDLSKLQQTARVATPANALPKNSSAAWLLWLFVLVFLAAAVIWWVLRRKRRARAMAQAQVLLQTTPSATVSSGYLPPLQGPSATSPAHNNPEPTKVVSAIAKHRRKHKSAVASPAPPPAHMGESLRDMVIQSMAKDAAEHPENRPKPPIVPGA